jgi:hypothetical protein
MTRIPGRRQFWERFEYARGSQIMKTTFMPQTKPGKSSVELGVILIIMQGIILLVAYMQGPGAEQTFFNNPFMGITRIGVVVVALITFLTGLAAMVKNKERSISVYVMTALGFMVMATQH